LTTYGKPAHITCLFWLEKGVGAYNFL